MLVFGRFTIHLQVSDTACFTVHLLTITSLYSILYRCYLLSLVTYCRCYPLLLIAYYRYNLPTIVGHL